VPFATFVAGAVLQLVFQRYTDDNLTDTDQVVFALVAAETAVLVLIGTFILADNRNRSAADNALVAKFNDLANRFAMNVDFCADTEGVESGLTYVRTTGLIEQCTKSLVFVDYWIATGNYLSGHSAARDHRDKYYEAILEKIDEWNRRPAQTVPFHRRIVQMPELAIDGTKFTLTRDPRFHSYLKACLEMQQRDAPASTVKVAPPLVHAHFAIIDGRHVVFPILTSSPDGSGGLRRHGALVFDDVEGKYVECLMAIFHKVDSLASPLGEAHLA
jgi:hypothetical protein